jgi:anhydro-N-acetylmuramic acid kinase
MTTRERYAGVMSGTSLDGVDAVVAEFAPTSGRVCETLGAAHLPFPRALRDALASLQASGTDELARAADATVQLADLYAEAIVAACANASLAPGDLVAAGVHGQTVRHRPESGWTIQLNDAARVAERAGVTVVSGFRHRDIAAGGQGAPLVPAFPRGAVRRPVASPRRRQHRRHREPDRPAARRRRARLRHRPGQRALGPVARAAPRGPFDADGAWAACGRPVATLLDAMLGDPYFARKPPRAPGATASTRAGWTNTSRRARRARRRPTCRRRSSR